MGRAATQPIVDEIERQVVKIEAVFSRFPWDNPRAYGNFLAQTFYYVRRVSHVLAAALARTPLEDTQLHDHLVKALIEEKDHGILAINDLRDLDYTIAQFPEHPLTRAYYQTLFYMVDTMGPAALMGYFFTLEAFTATRGRQVYDPVEKAYGGKALSFLHEHILVDAEHFPQAVGVLDILSEPDRRAVHEAVQLSGPLYRYLIAAIAAELES